jgi:hypothetical protein
MGTSSYYQVSHVDNNENMKKEERTRKHKKIDGSSVLVNCWGAGNKPTVR